MSTIEEIQGLLEDNKSRIYKKDYNFFGVDFISTLAKASVREGCTCKDCCNNVERLKVLAASYPELIVAGETGKRQLEDNIDSISEHLISVHGYARAGWYKSLYSFVGLGIGIVLSLLIVWITSASFDSGKLWFLIITGILMLVGYVVGLLKDFKYEKKEKKL